MVAKDGKGTLLEMPTENSSARSGSAAFRNPRDVANEVNTLYRCTQLFKSKSKYRRLGGLHLITHPLSFETSPSYRLNPLFPRSPGCAADASRAAARAACSSISACRKNSSSLARNASSSSCLAGWQLTADFCTQKFDHHWNHWSNSARCITTGLMFCQYQCSSSNTLMIRKIEKVTSNQTNKYQPVIS